MRHHDRPNGSTPVNAGQGPWAAHLGRTLIRLAQERRAAAALVAAPAEELIAHYGIKPEIARAIAARPQAEKLAGELKAQGIRLLIRDGPGYPVRLVGGLGGVARRYCLSRGMLHCSTTKRSRFPEHGMPPRRGCDGQLV